MNKFFAIVILIWFSGFGLMGFDNTEQSKFLEQFNSINKNGMYVLGSWAVLNIVSGTIGNFSTSGRTKYFHQMNAVWNSVNLGIAVFSLMNLPGNDLTLIDSFKEYSNLQAGDFSSSLKSFSKATENLVSAVKESNIKRFMK